VPLPSLPPPTSSSPPRRPEAWRHFCPFFLHYNRAARTQACARAASQAGYDPAWQLDPPPPGLLPVALEPLEAFAAGPGVALVVRYLLASALEGEPWGLPKAAEAEAARAEAEARGPSSDGGGGGGAQRRPWGVGGGGDSAAAGLAALAAEARRAAAAAEGRGWDGKPLVREEALLCSLHLLYLGLSRVRAQLQQRAAAAAGAAADASGAPGAWLDESALSELLGHLAGPPVARRSADALLGDPVVDEGVAGAPSMVRARAGLPGILLSLAALLGEAPPGAWGPGAAAPAPPPGLVSAEAAACCRAALALAREVAALGRGSAGGADSGGGGPAQRGTRGAAGPAAAAAGAAGGIHAHQQGRGARGRR
jgi:hypothetical protein